MKLGTWLLALVQPMLAKILLSLGFAVVSITGMEAVLNQVKQVLIANVNNMSGDMLAIFLFAGGGKVFGMILGSVATKVMLWQITQSTKILGVNPQ
ncbi:DUF2523 domain-containing protein [uncultured Xylophilus sp.]|uniref:DUF2523 domain-containing protein n=1 Tax=uncultured Xylophilus sp. TaxID=296832 RepID=UPI0025F77C0A|nr:DUF2523 domain-containing protein [uncultured Xylophilus sp.]